MGLMRFEQLSVSEICLFFSVRQKFVLERSQEGTRFFWQDQGKPE